MPVVGASSHVILSGREIGAVKKMNKTMKYLTGVAFALCAASSIACSKPEVPTLPDPATAVTPQMVKAKNQVKRFMGEADEYLKCNITTKQHNMMVKKMHKLADAFNGIVRAYKERMAG